MPEDIKKEIAEFSKKYKNLSLKEIWSWARTHKLDLLFLTAAGALGIYFHWTIGETVVFVIFIGIILHPISSRVPAAAALIFLIFTPFLLIFKLELLAESSAIYAYYFLIMAVIMGVYEIRREEKEKTISSSK